VTVTRKEFCLAAGATVLAGCEKIPRQLRPGFRMLEREDGIFQAPVSASVDLVSHVLNRLSFGPRGGGYGRVISLGATQEQAVAAHVEQQLDPESIDDAKLNYAIRRLECLQEPVGELFEYKPAHLLQQMTRAAILRAVWSERQLFEVMARFWSDHFNIDASKGDCRWLKAADELDVVRPHALGNFPALLRASALSPAMLWYLDGRANRKQQGNDKPNENYARELLELHTLGIHSGYTQRDIMEVARCLSGWTVRGVKQFRKGEVEFQREQHDDGEKQVLGATIPAGLGAGDVDRVLALVSLHPATARHIAEKLCRHFIADVPPQPAIDAVAKSFLDHRGEIKPVLRTLFARTEFIASRQTKQKRPFEFVVSALRATQADTDGGPALTEFLLRMGHAPYQYPTPEGYADRAGPWMGTLLWRWKFSVALATNSIKGTSVDWDKCRRSFRNEESLVAHLLGRMPNEEESQSFGVFRERPQNGFAVMLASPGFQRC
jgi:uncharacterized protein (DUF1800 family)